MQNTNTKEKYRLAFEYHRQLPDNIREYLHGRGIPDPIIRRYRLGWNGERITIPITNRNREVVFFKLAKEKEATRPDIIASEEHAPELYGWERVVYNRPQIIICQGEWDRLILESRGFTAIASTAGPGVFLPEWAKALEETPWVYICFHNDSRSSELANGVASLIPQSRVITLPEEVGLGGTLADYFLRLGKTDEDFRKLLKSGTNHSTE